MSATEAVATNPEETKAMAEEPVVPAVEAAVIPDAMPAADAKVADATPAADAKPADAMPADAPPTDAMPKDETKAESKVTPRGIFRLLSNTFKPKASKSPKKEKKEEKKDKKEEKKEEAEVIPEQAPMATPAADAATSAEVPKVEEVTMATDSAQATQNPVAAVTEEVKEAPKEMSAPKETSAPNAKASKLGRRISYVTDIFSRKPKVEVPTSPKVDELPPKIDEPASVAPLENPASEPVKAAEVATPVVAATA